MATDAIKLSPCPFCASTDVELDEDPAAGACDGRGEVWVHCTACEACGPRTRLGCRAEDEDGPIDLEQEAVSDWNVRDTVSAILTERARAIAILASAAPNTRAEKSVQKVAALLETGTVTGPIADALSEWLTVTADELRDLEEQIASGVRAPATPIDGPMLHVDDFIDDPGRDPYARWIFLLFRLSALNRVQFKPFYGDALLFCTYEGRRYRCTGASRLGDVWLAADFGRDCGYDLRVDVAKCEEWGATA